MWRISDLLYRSHLDEPFYFTHITDETSSLEKKLSEVHRLMNFHASQGKVTAKYIASTLDIISELLKIHSIHVTWGEVDEDLNGELVPLIVQVEEHVSRLAQTYAPIRAQERKDGLFMSTTVENKISSASSGKIWSDAYFWVTALHNVLEYHYIHKSFYERFQDLYYEWNELVAKVEAPKKLPAGIDSQTYIGNIQSEMEKRIKESLGELMYRENIQLALYDNTCPYIHPSNSVPLPTIHEWFGFTIDSIGYRMRLQPCPFKTEVFFNVSQLYDHVRTCVQYIDEEFYEHFPVEYVDNEPEDVPLAVSPAVSPTVSPAVVQSSNRRKDVRRRDGGATTPATPKERKRKSRVSSSTSPPSRSSPIRFETPASGILSDNPRSHPRRAGSSPDPRQKR
mgnify:FL=1